MKKIPFNFDWERECTIDSEELFFLPNKPIEAVNLPDDYIINTKRNPKSVGGAFAGYYNGGSALYRKKFTLPQEWKDKTVILDVDGAYQTSEVIINTERVDFNAYGYSPFCVNLTPWLCEKNTLEIMTENHQPNSRWYSGGGLFRQVHMLVGGDCYLHPWSVHITTPEIMSDKAVIKVEFGVTNTTRANKQLTIKLVIRNNGEEVSAEKTSLYSFAGKETNGCIMAEVLNPHLWDTESPQMYEAELIIIDGEEIVDTHLQSFGIRKLEFSVEYGMKLNGKNIKLRGGCFHHDHAALGAAAYPAAEERKLRILKDLGYNAVRTSHNPPSYTFLDLCDKLGILVLDEAFDCWLKPKTGNDYSRHFRDNWKRDLTAMVRRDRNHPCIFAWSIGNEIPEVEGSKMGVEITRQLADCVRSLDLSRPVTIGQHGVVNYERAGIDIENFDFNKLQAQKMIDPGVIDGVDVWGEQTERHFELLDIAGYNYMYARYSKDAIRYPRRIILATETSPTQMYSYWTECAKAPNCIGDFIWTAYDNIGEAGTGRVVYDEKDYAFLQPYPWLSNSQGDCNLDGDRRPQSFYHKILWGLDDGIHLFSYHPKHYGKWCGGTGWNWHDVSREWTYENEYIGKGIKVEAYADCDEVEFILNGKSIARVEPVEYIAEADLQYERGVLEAVAYKNGKEIARDVLESTGEPAELVLIPEKTEIKADGYDLAFVRLELHDSEGRLVTNTSVEVSVQANSRMWLGSGNPCTDEDYGTGKRRTWQGKALIIVGAERKCTDIEITVTSDNNLMAETKIKCI